MKNRLELAILPQPDFTTCGPTCLHAVYAYYGDTVPLDQVIKETTVLDTGGTLPMFLGSHALARGYKATICTYNLHVFDPTWFALSTPDLRDRLEARAKARRGTKIETAVRGFVDFLDAGGEVVFEDLKTSLIRRYLKKGIPILCGLSSTYLYRVTREYGPEMLEDDVRGDPQGHFVVLCGYDKEDRTVLVADPMHPNPSFQGLQYVVSIDRVICSILLGIVTHDADLLIIEPPKPAEAAEKPDRPSDAETLWPS